MVFEKGVVILFRVPIPARRSMALAGAVLYSVAKRKGPYEEA